ncbi:MAG: hypothetical protein Q9182_006438 [Xanthomendoza sp. 2 TL-2023]
MATIIVTPWRSQRDLLRIRDWLFPPRASEAPDPRRKACSQQIQAWKLRGSLPHAIESTWYITEAILTDGTSDQAGSLSALALRSCYCTAFCRFVTGFLDSTQESFYKVSMFDKARELNLPAAFVELRHEAIHGELPSLVVLRQAAQKSLDWLWKNYWKCLADGSDPADVELPSFEERCATLRQKLRDILQSYIGSAPVPPKPTRKSHTDDQVQSTCNSILELLQNYNQGEQASVDLISILIDDWLSTSASNMRWSFPIVTPNESTNDDRLDQHLDSMGLHWDPLLRSMALQRPYVLRILSGELIERLTAAPVVDSVGNSSHACFLAVLERLYTAPEWHKGFDESNLDEVDMVSKCLQSPNRWTIRLATSISKCQRHARVRRMFEDRIVQVTKGQGIVQGGKKKGRERDAG